MSDQDTTLGLITLYQLDLAKLGGPIYYFNSAENTTRLITWGGQQYTPLPMSADGFEWSTKGSPPQPTLKFSNLYGAGNALLDEYNGLIGADLIRIVTLERFLDDGSTPDPNAYLLRDIYTVAQKTSHTAVLIAFKMMTRMDQQGSQIPRRLILRDTCTYVYRIWNATTGAFDYSKATCPYAGGGYFDINDIAVGPQQDQCSHTLTGCTLRYGQAPLPAQMFPAVGKVK